MRSSLFAAAVALVASTLAAPPLLAQPKKPATAKDASTAEAKRLFDEGRDAYAAGDYEKAAAAWEKSYEISKEPLIFEGLANAYERLGKAKRARDYLKRWRDAAPASEHAQLDQHLKNLDARIAKEDAEEAAHKEDEARRENEAARRAAEAARPKKEPLTLGQQIAPPLLGGGVALVATGVTMDIVASVLRPNADDVCKTSAATGARYCLASASSTIGTSSTLALVGDVLWISGVAAVGVSTFLFLKSKPKPSKEGEGTPATATVAPIVGPRTGGASLRVVF